MGYLSNNVGVLSGLGLTKEECSCQCQDNDKCVAWTFAQGKKHIGEKITTKKGYLFTSRLFPDLFIH